MSLIEHLYYDKIIKLKVLIIILKVNKVPKKGKSSPYRFGKSTNQIFVMINTRR